MCNRYSPARRSFVILSTSTVTSGTGGFMPLRRRSSKGTETFAKRFVQYGLIWRYSIFFVPAMIFASHSRSMEIVIRSQFSFFIGVRTHREQGAGGVPSGSIVKENFVSHS